MAEPKQLCMGTCYGHAAHERAIEKHDKRLDSHGESLDKINDCITRLTLLQEQSLAWQHKADDRIRDLETAPAKRWDHSINTAITAIVSAVVGAVIAFMSTNMIGGAL